MTKPEVNIPSKIICAREDGTNSIFISHEKLGHGGFAVVHRVTEQNTNKSYAMKIIPKDRYQNAKNKSYLEKIHNEIHIQKNLNHQNVVYSKLSFSDDQNQYILLEYCPGKSVREYLRKSKLGYLSEIETRKILKDVIQGLVYLHNHKVVHHDLKLDNFLIGADGRVKIADFGVSSLLINSNDKILTFCGTTNYMSPEMLQKENKGHSFEVDIWAIGVCAFVMLTGQQPFGYDKESVYEKIRKCDYHFPPNIQLSYEASDFIRTVLRIDPKRRPTANELMKHPFLTIYDKEPVHLYKPIIQVANKPIHSISSLIINTNNNNNKFNIGCFNNLCGPLYLRNSSNNVNIIKPRISDDFAGSLKKPNFQVNRLNSYMKKTFVIPTHYVTKYCFSNEDLGYLLGNGTVGVCFYDRSRMVMDPNEEFVQYYKDYNSDKEIIDLDNDLDENQRIKLQAKIDLIRKFAKNFKKYKYLYKYEGECYDSCIPLNHVKCFVKQNDAILFKKNDKNIQVIFYDHKKLIILWNTKKMCLVKNLNEKCNLMDLKDVVVMSPNSDEFKKYKAAKDLLISLSMKI